MSISKKVYFSPLGIFISIIQHLVGLFRRPVMMYGYYSRITNRYLKGVRISSSAVISDKNKLNIGDNVWINH